jgi:hypothetical protein
MPPRSGSRGNGSTATTPETTSNLSSRVEALYDLGRKKVEAKKNLTEQVRVLSMDFSFFNAGAAPSESQVREQLFEKQIRV